MHEPPPDEPVVDRRSFLKTAGIVAVATTGVACDIPGVSQGASPDSARVAAARGGLRDVGFDGPTLAAVAEVVLPGELGVGRRGAAVESFLDWIRGYDPVAERMHGYGYADILYLPPDPAPNWRAQLEGLDILARRSRGRRFAELPLAERRAMVEDALSDVGGERLPPPLAASHVAVALLAHWASSPAAWDLAFGARITPTTCRPLADVTRRPPGPDVESIG